MSRPKNSFEPYPDPKNSPLGLEKVKTTPKLNQSKVRIEGNIEKKIVQLHEQTLKQFLDTTPTPKIAHQGPNRHNQPKIKSTSKVRIEGNIENEIVFEPHRVPRLPKQPIWTPKQPQNLVKRYNRSKQEIFYISSFGQTFFENV